MNTRLRALIVVISISATAALGLLAAAPATAAPPAASTSSIGLVRHAEAPASDSTAPGAQSGGSTDSVQKPAKQTVQASDDGFPMPLVLLVGLGVVAASILAIFLSGTSQRRRES
ncbi:hypothetical protein [Galbitalea soli]|uniref:Uncharacterized protein n=1 Tax=Galbitalea soli TaxID=1268042 RepID=A0A7C9PPH0_9MICO|nr:hypothetical protein [Galbitalea soli]NEM92108.1 hypothetical protein [Galbitalea soli]NYJ31940.1 hypothetical protein [Galbitalea soli]